MDDRELRFGEQLPSFNPENIGQREYDELQGQALVYAITAAASFPQVFEPNGVHGMRYRVLPPSGRGDFSEPDNMNTGYIDVFRDYGPEGGVSIHVRTPNVSTESGDPLPVTLKIKVNRDLKSGYLGGNEYAECPLVHPGEIRTVVSMLEHVVDIEHGGFVEDTTRPHVELQEVLQTYDKVGSITIQRN